MKQCSQVGHYYDSDVYPQCPYCNNAYSGGTPHPENLRTMPLASPKSAPTVSSEGRTVAVVKNKLGVDPVVGWLVNLDGTEKGRDYRIRTDNNFIGRSEKMDICIGGDDTISRENHAIISYDSRDRMFYFTPGDGHSIVRLNNRALFMTAQIRAHDVIEIGKTRLIFVPLCGEAFEWA